MIMKSANTGPIDVFPFTSKSDEPKFRRGTTTFTKVSSHEMIFARRKLIMFGHGAACALTDAPSPAK